VGSALETNNLWIGQLLRSMPSVVGWLGD